MKRHLLSLIFIVSSGFIYNSSAQITLLNTFNPSGTGSLCGIGYETGSDLVWVYGCVDGTIQCYDNSGNFLTSVPVPGGPGNDVDVEIATEPILFNGGLIPQGQLLFVNGEDGYADIFAIDNVTGGIINTLSTQFGASHVVGGSYHPDLDKFFLVQDNVPSVTLENMIAEIDPQTGIPFQNFQITEFFEVSYGDIEVGANGNLFVVSSIEDHIAEFTPQGDFIQLHALPAGVSNLSGIALDCDEEEAWVSSTSGSVYRLGQFPCGVTGFTLDLKVFIEGSFNTATAFMNTDLNAAGLLPLSQPFNISPWDYAGTENVAVIPNANVVDWVLVEFRDATIAATATAATRIARQAAFILSDGSIKAMDGSNDLVLNIPVTNNLFVVIWHKNHLGVMSADPLTLSGGNYAYDFTTGVSQAYGGSNGHKGLASGKWGMFSGDGDANNTINPADKAVIWAPNAGLNGYLNADFNRNGQVNNPDKNDFWQPNLNKVCQVP